MLSVGVTEARDPKELISRSALRTREVFGNEYAGTLASPLEASQKTSLTVRMRAEYDSVRELPPHLAAKLPGAKKQSGSMPSSDPTQKLIQGIPPPTSSLSISQALTLRSKLSNGMSNGAGALIDNRAQPSSALIRRQNVQPIKPEWHAPWKLMRVISGHLGWVRSVAVEPGNQWFCTGAGDRTIKIWDLASGTLKLSLTGHISTVRGLAVSSRHPYLFSCGEDKMIKCYDLEQNKVIRHYHGHLSGVYSLSLHPTLDILVTSGRDAVARVWDIRTRQNIHVLGGHTGTVSDVKCQEADPQVITGSMDSTIRLWDLAAGKSMAVLTHHKKSVRALALHPNEFTFASGSADNVKQWKCPEGTFMQNFEGHNAIVNTLSINSDNVLFSGADNGSMCFYDWKSGYKYQSLETTVQPGSLEAEAGIFASTFDKTGLRLITCEADKTIKIWKQDENATEETHPIEWAPTLSRRKF
ncbi:Pre-mRNA-splicing factor prp46 [Neolecta irregularis DAH-3]|uniref:Pre-mRNA-splicing factor PRP46 n=1 Tax=Neolecta irregularis (strain DAH-3) TaxID=1198029 RepID=A0A1U7LGY2_NEOID|nr:Pre-mRNA-splicing factor prp46 [Neolecta irregularis DAH-3]|eukprot:OLL21907.1 Pre-mRNA-splicing factor prp46 [Neolecta irregularis DAH-3]